MPDALLLRCEKEIPQAVKNKIALMCDVESAGVVACPDSPSIYDIPRVLYEERLDTFIIRKLGLPFQDIDWSLWGDLLERVYHPEKQVNVGIVGKYIDLPDAYLSVAEAIRAAGFHHRAQVVIRWIASDDCVGELDAVLKDVDAVVIPGGFGGRGIEGKINVIRYSREQGLPLLGICLGMQCVVIEAARAQGLTEATSTEFDPGAKEPVIATMEEQLAVVDGEADLGGTMRLGAYPACLVEGSRVAQAYGATQVSERHRHRYEVNNAYRQQLGELVVSGTSPDGKLVEFVEYPHHPFLVATQAHPELKSRPTKTHPLFVALLEAALKKPVQASD